MIQNYKILQDVFYKLKITKKVHMAGIIRHYKLLEMVAEQGVEFHSTVLNLCRAYSEFRPVHGDGECFYRSFIFSYLSKFFIGRIHMRNTVFFLVLPCFGYQSPALQPRAQCPFCCCLLV